MLKVYRNIWDILLLNERKNLLFLFLIVVIQALFEFFGVISIYPLISSISDVEFIQSNKQLFYLYNLFGFNNYNYFLIFISFCSFLIILIRTVVNFISNYFLTRFVRKISHKISYRLLVSYISRPYKFFLNKNSSELSTTILHEVEQAVGGCIFPCVQLIAQLLTLIGIFAAIKIVKTTSAFLPLFFVIIFYVVIMYFINNRIKSLGEKRSYYNRIRYFETQELFSGIKEVKLSGKELIYADNFSFASSKYANVFIKYALIKDFPRYLLELLSIGGVFLLILTSFFQAKGDLNLILPSISVFAFAGLRLLPSVQKVYQSFISLRFNSSVLRNLKESLISSQKIKINKGYNVYQLQNELVLKNISYVYPLSNKKVIDKINLKIKAKTMIGIVGSTGSGKSTLIDIISGLLKPTSGEILLDQKPFNENIIESWQNSIGFVPQEIFISDDTILKNIAFGEDLKDIDIRRVEKASKMANIYDFINDQLEEGFDTKLGERGIRLSGGQKQRIGIARALYLDPPILLLDEATSSLDNLTEKSILKSLEKVSDQKTIIMIAHRLSTIKNCDNIFFLEDGKLIAQGIYDELMKIKKFKNFTAI